MTGTKVVPEEGDEVGDGEAAVVDRNEPALARGEEDTAWPGADTLPGVGRARAGMVEASAYSLRPGTRDTAYSAESSSAARAEGHNHEATSEYSEDRRAVLHMGPYSMVTYVVAVRHAHKHRPVGSSGSPKVPPKGEAVSDVERKAELAPGPGDSRASRSRGHGASIDDKAPGRDRRYTVRKRSERRVLYFWNYTHYEREHRNCKCEVRNRESSNRSATASEFDSVEETEIEKREDYNLHRETHSFAKNVLAAGSASDIEES